MEEAAGRRPGRRSRSSPRGPLSARWTAVPRPRQSLTSSRTRTRRPRDGRAVEHVVDREHVRPVHAGEPVDQRQRPLEPGPRRSRPGRDDRPRRRTRSPTPVGGRLHAEPDLHAERLEPPSEPGEQVRDLAARRLEPGQPELAAERRPALRRASRGGRAPPRPEPPPARPARHRRPGPAAARRPARTGRRPTPTRAPPTG